MKIIQLVPHPPNRIGGICTYSLKLAEKLLEDYNIFTYFVIFLPVFKDFQSAIHEFPINLLTQKTPEALLSLIPEDVDTIILHYCQPEGCLFDNQYWLMKLLQKSVKQKNLKLIVIFHEMSLTFSLKKKIKFLYPQRFFAAYGIAKMAHTVFTPSANFQAILAKWLGFPVRCMPVFSNIGEPKYVPALEKRKRRMIVFGTGYSRERVYKKFHKELLLSCRGLDIQEIYDVGGGLKPELPNLQGIRLVRIGEKPSEVVSQLMLDSFAGFFDYSHTPEDIGKSGIFAAYCSHGLIPISSRYNAFEATGLELNKHYIVANKQFNNLSLIQLKFIADNAHQWYKNHDFEKLINILSSCLLEQVTSSLIR